MRPQDILELLRTKPFRPFRIRMSDGQHFEVRHPELAMVDQRVTSEVYAVAVRVEDRALLETIDRALETMAQDGTLGEIRARWLGSSAR